MGWDQSTGQSLRVTVYFEKKLPSQNPPTKAPHSGAHTQRHDESGRVQKEESREGASAGLFFDSVHEKKGRTGISKIHFKIELSAN